jgi:hypothetical protein
MRSKLILVSLIGFLGFGSVAAFADQGTVILDTISKAEAEQLNIVIPPNTPPGFHVATIQVVDPTNGIVSSRDIHFCVDAKNIVHWDNKCPDLNANAPYDPTKDLNHVVGTLVAGLAAVNVLTSNSDSKDKSDREEGSLESIEAGARIALRRNQGRGDRSRSWRWPFTKWYDREMGLYARDFSKYSPLISRVFSDANYLRAMLGSFTFLLYPFAIYFGVHALKVNDWKPIPSSVPIMLSIIGIGIVDSLAGFLAGYTYFIGVLISGNMHTRDNFLSTLGVIIIFFGPILISSSLRPLRRHVKDLDSFWERATDYALAILLSGWAVQKMIGALPGLSGHQVSLTAKANSIGIYAGLFVALRFIFEEIGTYLYPERTLALEVESKKTFKNHKYFEILSKTIMFNLVAEPFIGNSPELLIGTLLFAFPQFLKLYSKRFPKFKFINYLIPKGAFNIIAMLFVGALFAKLVHNAIPDPHKFLRYGFVVLGLPGLFFSLLKMFAAPVNSEKSWKETFIGRPVYRILGIGIYALIVLDIAGKDLVTPAQHFFGFK